jgi:hypothetical protein
VCEAVEGTKLLKIMDYSFREAVKGKGILEIMKVYKSFRIEGFLEIMVYKPFRRLSMEKAF